jgi:putative ABC transport system permease protein
MSRCREALGPYITEHSPEVASYCLYRPERYNFEYGDKKLERIRTLKASSSFTDFFHFKTIAGDLNHTLNDPSSVAITQDMASRLFGDENPLGKIITFDNLDIDMEGFQLKRVPTHVTVSSVLANLPKNTLFQFDALLSFDAYTQNYRQTFSFDVFVLLMTETTTPNLETITEACIPFFEPFTNLGVTVSNSLQPLGEIHFGPYDSGMGQRGNKRQIIIYSLIAGLIIIIAVINFINLVTARSAKRAVEASIRKVSGAGKKDIFTQFLGESILISFIAFVAALLLVEITISPFSNLLNRELSVTPFQNPFLLLKLMAGVVVLGILSGLYPAMVFSAYKPAEIMRGKHTGGSGKQLLRVVLVVIQFIISIILIVSISVFHKQVDYMKNASTGFDTENILIFRGVSPSIASGFEAMKAELLQNPEVLFVSRAGGVPGYGSSGQAISIKDDPGGSILSVDEFRVHEDYFETFNFKLKQGRWFDFQGIDDRNNFILNQTAVNALGLADPIGTELKMFDWTGRIIGVVEDFHAVSLKNQIDPIIFTSYRPDFYFIVVKTRETHQLKLRII